MSATSQFSSAPHPVIAGLRFGLPELLAVALLGVAARLMAYAWMGTAWGGLAEAMCHFDCGWYERIALAGYGADSEFGDLGSYPHWAFFPLYPILLRAVIEILPLPAQLGGILLSCLCLTGFIVVGAAYLRQGAGRMHVARWVAVVLLVPNTHFFSALYTEALFALLSTACLLALATDRPLLAAGLAALASATRPTGIALSLLVIGERLGMVWRQRHAADRLALAEAGLLPIAVAPLGLSAYMVVQYLAVGDALAFSHVQLDWGRVWRGPIVTLADGLRAWDWERLAGPMTQASASYAAAWALLGLAVAVVLGLRRRFAEAWFLAACVLLPAATGLDSLPRYVATNPVFLFAIYRLLGRMGGSARGTLLLAGLTLVASAAAHAVLLHAWMSGAGGVF